MFSKEQFATVTPLSKALAMIVFITLPFAAFFLGMNFGQQSSSPVVTEVVKTTDDTEKLSTLSSEGASYKQSYLKPPIPEGWAEYVDIARGFAFYYPDDWFVNESTSVTLREDGEWRRTTRAGGIILNNPAIEGQSVYVTSGRISLDQYARGKGSFGTTVEEVIKNRRAGTIYLTTTKQNGLVFVEHLRLDEDPYRNFIVTFLSNDGSVVDFGFGNIATPSLEETINSALSEEPDFADKVKSSSSLDEVQLQILASLRGLILQ